MSINLDNMALLSTVEEQPEPSFSWAGCEAADCEGRGLGADVYACQGYRTLAEAQAGPDNVHEFNLCGQCLYEYHYGAGSYGA